MKKFFVSLLVALCGAVPLFADDAADIKAVILKNHELQERHDFMGTLALHTKDYCQFGADGRMTGYEQAKRLFTALDGNHPEEFLLFMAISENGGEMPAEEMRREMRRKIRAVARDPEFIREYKTYISAIIVYGDLEAAAWRKTARIVSVKVDGDSAVAVIEYDGQGAAGAVVHKIDTISFRKVGGAWKICKSVIAIK